MKTKVCSKCTLRKSIDLFYKSKLRKDGRSSRCKTCDDFSNTATRKKDSVKSNLYRQRWKTELFDRINIWKHEQGCKFCTETEPCCLELHHTDPSAKETHPSLMRTSWDRFMQEAKKCIVVCSNCHKKIHKGLLILEPK